MNRACRVFLTVVLGAASLYTQHVASTTVAVVPSPYQVVSRNCEYRILRATKIVLDGSSSRDRFAAEQINEQLTTSKTTSLRIQLVKPASLPPTDFIFIGSPSSEVGRRLLRDRGGEMKKEMSAEGYFLDVDTGGVVIVAERERGRFYGVMTLLQLMQQNGEAVRIPGVSIHDFPQYQLRGISDDISRGQVSTLENFKKIIRFLARYKMNVYSPYLEDMVVFRNHPLIGQGRGALTITELKELDAYARQYFVDIVPIFQTLGHCENLLSIPEYLSYAEYPGGRTLNVSDEKTYTLLDEMIGEICSAVSSPYFHMGADETRDVGLGASRERVEKLGLPTVLAEHYKRVAAIIRNHGKKPMIYGDILLKNQEILGMIPNDITIVDWNYDPDYRYDSPQIFRKAGFPVVVSPAIRNYRGPFLDHLNSFENIERFSRAGYEEQSIGVLVSSWNDYGGEELRELNYYGYAWSAECGWRAMKADRASFNEAFFRDFFATGETDALQSVYAILSSPANSYTWYELWRNPMLPLMPAVTTKGHTANIMERLQSIKSSMPLVLSLMKRASGSTSLNNDHLEYLAFVARLNLWFARKVEAAEKVKELSRWAASSTHKDSVQSAVIRLCEGVIEDLQQRRNEFGRLWRKTNKPEGLEYLLMRYDRQRSFWQEKIDQVKQGIFWVDPEIESRWIYHPGVKMPDGSATRVQHAHFRKTIDVPNDIRSAQVQLIGDTYVTLSVNGHDVGEVYVRRSNSLSAEHKRIRCFNILPFLSGTTIVIAAEARDYSSDGSAGVNIYGELQLPGGSILKIKSDSTWKVTSTPGTGWKGPRFDESDWVQAATKVYPYAIDRPNFATGRLSWIEQ